MKFRDLLRKRDYIAICRGKLSISRFFAEKRRFRDLSRKIANFAISTPPRQTNAPVHKLVHKIERAILNSGMALGTFLDIEGAFDNVAFHAIEKALNKKCSSGKFCEIWRRTRLLAIKIGY